MTVNSRLRQCGSATCTAMLKTILFLFNVIVFGLGASLLFLGVYGLKDFHSFFTFTSGNSVWIALACIGLFMLFTALLSFWCIPKGVSWLLNFYGAIIFILFVAVLVASSVFMVKRDDLEDTIKIGLASQMNEYTHEHNSIDLVQSQFKCCGMNNYTDWFTTTWANNHTNVPISCCRNQEVCVHMDLNPMNVSSIYQEGCYMKIKTIIEDEYSLIGGIGFTSAFIILIGALLAWWLASNVKSNRYEEMQ